MAACQDAICAIAYLHLVDIEPLRGDHSARQSGAPVWGHLPMNRRRSVIAPPCSVLEEARLAGYPPTLAVLCFTLRVLDIPLPAYRTAAEVVFVVRDQTVVATTEVESTDQVVAPQELADDDAVLALIAFNAQCLQRLLAATHYRQMVNDLPRSTRHGCFDRRAA